MDWQYLASDRQYRGLMLEIVRWLESVQYHVMIFRLCQPVWELFISAAFTKGIFKIKEGKTLEDYINVEWITPKRGYIHPVQDVSAIAMAIAKGLESRKRAVLASGVRVNQLDKENAEDIARAKDMGLPYSMLGLDKSSGTSPLDNIEQYSAAVRAGLITPQMLDEIVTRQNAGLPPLSEDAITNWEKYNGVKGPITLAKADTPPLDPSFVLNPETGELQQTDPSELPPEPQF